MSTHPPPTPGRRHAARLLALALCGLLYGLTRHSNLPVAERAALASRFGFAATPLPAPPGCKSSSVRDVHPALRHIDAWISSVGAAVTLGDLDRNGRPDDLCHVDPRFDSVVVEPAPGTGDRYAPRVLDPGSLLRVSAADVRPGATVAPMGAMIGDFDEDGRPDVLVYCWGRTPIVFHDPLGAPRPCELIPGDERWFTNAATAADFDGDGHIDLLFGNYFPDGARVLDIAATDRAEMQDSMSRAENGGTKHLLLWSPKGWVVHDDALPEAARRSWTLAVGAADLDGDLLPEIYLANDFGSDRLLHNRSTPSQPSFVVVEGREGFTDPASCVLGRDSFKGMGIDFGDLDGDGHPDLYVSNISTEFGLMESQLCFLATGELTAFAQGRAPYVERADALGLSRSGWAWDCKFADFDNDGTLEVLQATGFIRGTTNRWPELHELAMGNDQLLNHAGAWPRFVAGDDINGDQGLCFFARASNGRFVELRADIGLAGPHVGRGLAIADVDADGALDFAIADQWETSWFFHNRHVVANAALELCLLLPLADGVTATRVLGAGEPPPAGTRAAVGAHARVERGDGRVLVGEVDGGNGHSGRRAPELHFGLGAAPATPVTVDVRWRDVTGRINREQMRLAPGRHTIVLGSRHE